MEKPKDTQILCEECEGPLFTLRWIFRNPPEVSGLYRCCAGCGFIKAIMEGVQQFGEVV
jgi:hypothetical protein